MEIQSDDINKCLGTFLNLLINTPKSMQGFSIGPFESFSKYAILFRNR